MMVRPKICYFISFVILAVVLSLPVQSALLYQNGLKELPDIFNKISHMNWLMAGILVVTAIAIYNLSPTIKVLVPLSVLAVAWNNYLTGHYMTNFSMDQSILGVGLFAGLMTPLARKDIRYLLKNPKMRWWVRAPRRHHAVPVTVNPYVGSTWQSKTFDISETGAFISFDKQDFDALPKVGEEVKLNININTLKKIRCEAIVVRVVEPMGNYPRGMGVRFVKFTDGQKRNLANYLEH